MARGTTLGQLILMLRAEIGDATSASLGQNNLPHLQQALRRTQEFLWQDFSWPHLRVYREDLLEAGQRYYSFPLDLDFDRVENVHIRYDEDWRPVVYGIEHQHYNSMDPDLNEREDPVLRWQAHEGNQYEVWPLPATNGLRLRFEGIRKLMPLVNDGDRADLDDNLIVLFAAAEILSRRDSKDAQAKENLATRLYNRLRGQQTSKRKMVIMGGGFDPNQRPSIQRPRPLYGKRT